MSEKTKAYLKIAAMVLATVLLLVAVFVYKSWWIKIPALILAGGLGWVLFRTYLAMTRKKHALYGKVLSVTKPKNKLKLGKTVVLVKSGKVSKKLYSWQPLNLKVGNDYGFYYEEKSNQIIKYETLKLNQVARPKGNSLPPQFR